MRKYPATRNAISIAETLEPTSKNDGGDIFIIVEMKTGRKTTLAAREMRSGRSYPPMFTRAVPPAPTSSATYIINKPSATVSRVDSLVKGRQLRGAGKLLEKLTS
jgi:hypothetical protein